MNISITVFNRKIDANPIQITSTVLNNLTNKDLSISLVNNIPIYKGCINNLILSYNIASNVDYDVDDIIEVHITNPSNTKSNGN